MEPENWAISIGPNVAEIATVDIADKLVVQSNPF